MGFSFYSCTPVPPGVFHLIGPQTSNSTNVNPPLSLSWESPNPIGSGCTGSNVYQVFLSTSPHPDYFKQIDHINMTVSSLADGQYFWTVRAVNRYYFSDASDIFAFTVITH